MAGLSKSAVIKLILQYIGGKMLMQVPTTTIGGMPVAAQSGSLSGFAGSVSGLSDLSGLTSSLSDISAITGELGGLVGDVQALQSLTDDLAGTLSSVSGFESLVSNLGGETSSLNSLTSLTNNLNSLQGYVRQSKGSQKASDLSGIARSVATDSGGLQSGLSQISVNPLSNFLTQTKGSLSTLTASNYSGLDSTLPDVASDPALSTEYAELKTALGGSDGLSGAISQIDAYQLHTDRLSGVTLSSESDYSTEEESGTYYEYATIANNNTWETAIEFNARRYRSAKYFIQGTANNEHQTSEVFLIHDNNRVYVREVDLIYTQDPFIQFTGSLSDNVVRVMANTEFQNTSLVIYGIRLEVASNAESQSVISQDKILASARAMKGFYGEDGNNYVQLQSNSIFNTVPLTTIDYHIREMSRKINSNEFNALSTAQKQAYLRDYANTINSSANALQNSIDSDIAAYNDVSKKIEAASVLATINTNYSDPESKALLNLTLQPSVKSKL
jgi:hypothetical protein